MRQIRDIPPGDLISLSGSANPSPVVHMMMQVTCLLLDYMPETEEQKKNDKCWFDIAKTKLLNNPKVFVEQFEKLKEERKDMLSDEVVTQVKEVMKQAYNNNVSNICNIVRKHAEAIVKYHDARKITKKGQVQLPPKKAPAKKPEEKKLIDPRDFLDDDSEESRMRKDQELAEMFLIEEEARLRAEQLAAESVKNESERIYPRMAKKRAAAEYANAYRGRGSKVIGGGPGRPLGRRESRPPRDESSAEPVMKVEEKKDGEKDPLEYRVCQFFLHKFSVSSIKM
jgi:hypothetical protein